MNIIKISYLLLMAKLLVIDGQAKIDSVCSYVGIHSMVNFSYRFWKLVFF